MVQGLKKKKKKSVKLLFFSLASSCKKKYIYIYIFLLLWKKSAFKFELGANYLTKSKRINFKVTEAATAIVI